MRTTLDLGGTFLFCFQICIQEMFIDYQVNNNKHFRQENTSLLMINMAMIKKTYTKCHVHGYNFEFEDVVLNFSCAHPEASCYYV